MKKIIALIIAVTLFVSLSITSLAGDYDNDMITAPSGSTLSVTPYNAGGYWVMTIVINTSNVRKLYVWYHSKYTTVGEPDIHYLNNSFYNQRYMTIYDLSDYPMSLVNQGVVKGGEYRLVNDTFFGQTDTNAYVLSRNFTKWLNGEQYSSQFTPPLTVLPEFDPDNVTLDSGSLTDFKIKNIWNKVTESYEMAMDFLYDNSELEEGDIPLLHYVLSGSNRGNPYLDYLVPLQNFQTNPRVNSSWVWNALEDGGQFTCDYKNTDGTYTVGQYTFEEPTDGHHGEGVSLDVTPVVYHSNAVTPYYSVGETTTVQNIQPDAGTTGQIIYDYGDYSVSTVNIYQGDNVKQNYVYNYDTDYEGDTYYSTNNYHDITDGLLPDVSGSPLDNLDLLKIYRAVKGAFVAFVAFVPSMLLLFDFLPVWAITLITSVIVTFLFLGIAKFVFNFKIKKED